MTSERRTRCGGTVTTDGLIPNARIRWAGGEFFAPVRVGWVPGEDLPTPERTVAGLIYALPGGHVTALRQARGTVAHSFIPPPTISQAAQPGTQTNV